MLLLSRPKAVHFRQGQGIAARVGQPRRRTSQALRQVSTAAAAFARARAHRAESPCPASRRPLRCTPSNRRVSCPSSRPRAWASSLSAYSRRGCARARGTKRDSPHPRVIGRPPDCAPAGHRWPHRGRDRWARTPWRCVLFGGQGPPQRVDRQGALCPNPETPQTPNQRPQCRRNLFAREGLLRAPAKDHPAARFSARAVQSMWRSPRSQAPVIVSHCSTCPACPGYD